MGGGVGLRGGRWSDARENGSRGQTRMPPADVSIAQVVSRGTWDGGRNLGRREESVRREMDEAMARGLRSKRRLGRTIAFESSDGTSDRTAELLRDDSNLCAGNRE